MGMAVKKSGFIVRGFQPLGNAVELGTVYFLLFSHLGLRTNGAIAILADGF
jgi:hypothetical protein